MRAIWTGALALTILFLSAVTSRDSSPRMPALAGADVAFIGSSLTRFAVPRQGPPEGIFDDGRRHVRLTRSGATARQLTDMLSEAVAAGIPEIYIEVDPYIRSLKSDFRTDGSWASGFIVPLEQRIRSFGDRLRQSVRTLLGMRAGWRALESNRLETAYGGSLENFSDYYPARIHSEAEDSERLGAVLTAARNGAVELTLLSLPRSQTLAEYLGEEFRLQHFAASARLADRFDLPVLRIAFSWPDDHFSDRAHLNATGRDRVIETLRAASSDERD